MRSLILSAVLGLGSLGMLLGFSPAQASAHPPSYHGHGREHGYNHRGYYGPGYYRPGYVAPRYYPPVYSGYVAPVYPVYPAASVVIGTPRLSVGVGYVPPVVVGTLGCGPGY